ncbi:MAG: hypothetical protein HY332_24225 [Chloroflexi bacterium]|nr:hypothetical protein [Chloroflexota bacterium]
MSLALELEQTQVDHAGADTLPVAVLDYPSRRPVLEWGRLRRRRWWGAVSALPIELLVQAGAQVSAGDVLARFVELRRATAVDVGPALGLARERAAACLVRGPGEMVAEGDVLAERKSLGGLQRRTLRSPATGTLRHVAHDLGTAFIQPLAVESRIAAHLAGTVVEAGDGGVVIEGSAVAIAGAAGAGPAVSGILMLADHPNALPNEAAGAIVACAFSLDAGAIRQLADAGAVAIVAIGMDETAIERLGWDDVLWPESGRGRTHAAPPAPPLTVVLLTACQAQGAALHPAVWEALRPLAGRLASALGAEPGASPELLIPLDTVSEDATDAVTGHGGAGQNGAVPPDGSSRATPDEAAGVLRPGVRVTVTSGRAEGLSGVAAATSAGPLRLASEIRADVTEVKFPYDVRVRVPNLHLRVVP